MRRREFIAVLTGAVGSPRAASSTNACAPSGRLSQPWKRPKSSRPFIAAFLGGLSATGYVEEAIWYRYRWADGQYDRLPRIGSRVSISPTGSHCHRRRYAKRACRKGATDAIPIVFVLGSDPVEFGLVRSFASPGGNVTGVTVLDVE